MGWWNAPENPEIMVGDAVLDTVRHFLHDFSSEFQGDLSRKPILQELGYALNLAFKVNVDSDVVSGFDELKVKEIILETAKRKKDKRLYWRIIERQPDFVPGEEFRALRYVYGTAPNALIATDIFGNRKPIHVAEAKGLPEYSA